MTTTVSQQWNGQDVKVRGRLAASKSAFEIGLIVQAQAKALTPVLSGRLRGSITTQADTGEGTNVDAPATSSDQITAPSQQGEVLVGTAVDYGPYVEFGTRGSNAQPFLRPALDLARGRALTIVEQEGRMAFAEYLQ